MKIVIGQTNPTPGDFNKNVAQIIDSVRIAYLNHADLVVTPEMGIPGYLCRDSIFNEGFVEQNLQGVERISCFSKGLTKPSPAIVVGYVDYNRTGIGKPFHNVVSVIKNGVVIATYRKHLLPFYDVFDEGRYFEPGNELAIVDIGGKKWGLLICEDGWSSDKDSSMKYSVNPVEKYRAAGVDNFIWINSSPYVIGKPVVRAKIAKQVSSSGTVIYANQVGGMDDLVFDGNSLVASYGTIFYSCGSQQNEFLVDLSEKYGFQMVEDSIEQLKDYVVLGLRDYVKKSGFKHVVVASSGGIDSALVLCLACEAVGPENVHAIRMPSCISSSGSSSDAQQLHSNLGCYDYLVPVDHMPLLHRFNANIYDKWITPADMLGKYNKVADENIQARLRAIALMHFSNSWGALPLTTGNKSENATGYCTLGGDMMGGFAPIQDLYKTQVYALSKLYSSIPSEIINKPPSAELALNQTDEASLLPYDMLDPIICAYIELHISTFEAFKNADLSDLTPYIANGSEAFLKRSDAKEQYDRIIRLIDANEFKRRQAAPGIKVSRVAFGTGRRFPIVRRRW